jgi:hypothetical protein
MDFKKVKTSELLRLFMDGPSPITATGLNFLKWWAELSEEIDARIPIPPIAPWDIKPAAEDCRHGTKLCPVCHGWGIKPGDGGA